MVKFVYKSLSCFFATYLTFPIVISAEELIFPHKDASNFLVAEEKNNTLPQSSKVFMTSDLKKSNRLFTTADVLLWKAQQDDLGFAIKSKNQTVIRKGKGKYPKFNWDWGFRVGLGYNIPHDLWDIRGSYTRFKTQTRTKENVSSSEFLFPTWSYQSTGYVSQALAQWNMNLQLGDVEVGRAVLASKSISLRPFFGVRGAWIYQKYNISYKGGSALPLEETNDVSMKNNFWGVGGRIGLDSTWAIAKGWSFFGDGALSLLSGYFDVQQKDQLRKSDTTALSITDRPSKMISIFDLALGLQYDTFFDRNRYHLGIKMGYEFLYLFDQNEFIRFISANPALSSRSSGDLSLMGLSLGVRFDF
jgi:hypothetical protein